MQQISISYQQQRIRLTFLQFNMQHKSISSSQLAMYEHFLATTTYRSDISSIHYATLHPPIQSPLPRCIKVDQMSLTPHLSTDTLS